MGSKSARYRRQRIRMFEADPYCPQCGTLMVEMSGTLKRRQPQPDNMCTIEHKYSRLHPLRLKAEPWSHTILCRSCNNENGIRDELLYLNTNNE